MMKIILPILQIRRLYYIQTGPVEFPRHAGPGLRFPASRLTSPPLNVIVFLHKVGESFH